MSTFDIEADRERSHQVWLSDPAYPVRNLRYHGVEPSQNALNALDGPTACSHCGSINTGDGETLRLWEDLNPRSGRIVCQRPACQEKA